MAEHKHGEMDITENQRAFDGFITFTARSIVVIFAVLIFMAIFTI